jgi:uncharacterized protein (UPF0261 family)
MTTIAVLGTLDTKGEEHAFVADCIREKGFKVLLIDVGTGAPASVTPDITRQDVAAAGGIDLPALMDRHDRGECVSAMATAAAALIAELHQSGRIHGIISLGGGGGTAIGTAAMRALPLGIPKVMVSTLASGNTDQYMQGKDIVMVPSIVDVSGLNRVSRIVLSQAAGAICGMCERPASDTSTDRPLIAASMFGNTTECVNMARDILEKAGYEVLVFHAVGSGGRTMESLIESGMVKGVLDVTTTELADELAGGVLTAGPDRGNAAGRSGTPAIVTPGCMDMVNFQEPASVPARFDGRRFYHHNPQVTLMRTTPEECSQLGKELAEKVNQYTGPVTVLLPLKAISIISAEGQPFYDPAADDALFTAIRDTLNPGIPLVELDCEINSPEFAEACARELLNNIHSAD